MQFSVVGLPHYTIWHLYEPSFDDVRRMEEMEQERRRREEEEKLKKERMEKIEKQFDTDAKEQYEKDKEAMRAKNEQSRKVVLAKEAGGEEGGADPRKLGQGGVQWHRESDRERERESEGEGKVTKEEVAAGIADSEM